MLNMDDIVKEYCNYPNPLYFSLFGYSENEHGTIIQEAFIEIENMQLLEAKNCFKKLLDISNDEIASISSRMNMANCSLSSKNDIEEVRKEYRSIVEDLSRFNEITTDRLYFDIMENISIINMMDGWGPESVNLPEQYSQKALDEISDDLRKASHLLVMGKINCFLYTNDMKYEGSEDGMGFDLVEDESYLEVAKDYLERAYDRFKGLDHSTGMIDVNIQLIKVHYGDDLYKEHIENAISMLRNYNDSAKKIMFQMELAQIIGNRKDPRGLELIDKTIAIAEKIGTPSQQTSMMMSKAMILHNAGRSDEAMQLLNYAHDLIEKEGDQEKLKSCRNFMSIIGIVSGKSKDPMDHLRNLFENVEIKNFPPKDERSADIIKKLGKKLHDDLNRNDDE